MDEDFQTRMTLEQAAQHAALSKSAFARRFKTATGLSFHRFLILEGVSRATDLLESSDESVTNIALQCGFRSLDALGYNFRRHIGCTPSEYRSAFLAVRR